MPSVLERLRLALAPAILVERELASGGMGIVFVARDTVLDRPIAIKVLRPELATAAATERFVREGKAAARVRHPNVVEVYHAGIADGLPYFTMALVTGETLAARLGSGQLTAEETIELGRDLLGALGAAHAARLVHRDVKPSNIFLDHGHALLGDFGIACAVDTSGDSTLTGPGQRVGTVQYMAPEQHAGAQATGRSDLYSVGLVLFEACTGRPWDMLADPERADWKAVPLRLRRPLRKAVQLAPADRWQDAVTFLAALESRRPARRLMPLAALIALAAAYLFYAYVHRPTPRLDVVVFPFDVTGLVDTSLGGEITRMTRWYFERLPGLKPHASKAAARAWSSSTLAPAQRLAELTTGMSSRFGVWGIVRLRGATLEVEASVVNGRGEPVLQTVVQGDSADHIGLADRLGARLVGAMSPGLTPVFRRSSALTQLDPDAVLEFLQGEEAFARDAWLSAERHYERALAIDSTFVLAAWRLGNTRRWMPLRPTPPFPPGFLPLFRARGGSLPAVDQRLVEAQFAPSGNPRFAKYEEALRADPRDATAMLLYGDELFHRGPLAGRSLEEAADMLRHATEADPTLAPAWEHLAWALIRLGRRDEAARALDSLDLMAGRPEESEIYLPAFLRLAYVARFDPASLRSGQSALLDSPAALALAARGALAFDLPDFEVAFGRRLSTLDNAAASLRASGLLAQSVGLMALGRPAAAFTRLDSAASLFPDPRESRLQAAEWRVIPRAVGVPGVADEEVERGRRALEQMARADAGGRADWALALEAFARGDTAEGRRRWSEVGRSEPEGGPLGQLLAAMDAAARQDLPTALHLSAPALDYDSAGRAPDPFYRSALHLLRGEWLARAARPGEADRAWRWYENTDVVGWPAAEAQPAEVDWALASYARLRRAELAADGPRHASACGLARRLSEIWSQPEPALAGAVQRLASAEKACPA